MSEHEQILYSKANRVATVTLNRPEVNNAYDASLIHGVLSAMDELGRKPLLRVVVLKGRHAGPETGRDQAASIIMSRAALSTMTGVSKY